MIGRLDHVNLRTARLDAMTRWYEDILQLLTGPRPPFGFPGAWLYAGDHAIVHLVAVDTAPPQADNLALEHAAFQARGMAGFLDRLRKAGETYRVVPVPGIPVVQVNVWDPDGNHLHVDFDAAEAERIDADMLRGPIAEG